MDRDKLIHDWLVKTLKSRLSRDYKEIKDNIEGNKNEFQGHYPDLLLGNYGMTLAVVEVETERTITAEKASEWKGLADTGTKLILMVPKRSVREITGLLWDAAIADRVSVGTYDMNIKMP